MINPCLWGHSLNYSGVRSNLSEWNGPRWNRLQPSSIALTASCSVLVSHVAKYLQSFLCNNTLYLSLAGWIMKSLLLFSHLWFHLATRDKELFTAPPSPWMEKHFGLITLWVMLLKTGLTCGMKIKIALCLTLTKKKRQPDSQTGFFLYLVTVVLTCSVFSYQCPRSTLMVSLLISQSLLPCAWFIQSFTSPQQLPLAPFLEELGFSSPALWLTDDFVKSDMVSDEEEKKKEQKLNPGLCQQPHLSSFQYWCPLCL